jgi:hypothetical protein
MVINIELRVKQFVFAILFYPHSQQRSSFWSLFFSFLHHCHNLQVIAMSAPVFGRHSSYRNDIHVVSR